MRALLSDKKDGKNIWQGYKNSNVTFRKKLTPLICDFFITTFTIITLARLISRSIIEIFAVSRKL